MQDPTYAPIDENPIKGIDDTKSIIPVPKGATLTIAKDNKLTDDQIMAIRARTPKQLTKPLKGRGGKELTYVPIAIYIRKLNFVFGYGNWTHEITKSQVLEDHALVEGKLTIIPTGQVVMQFGGHPIARELLGYEKPDQANPGIMRRIDTWGWKKLQDSKKPEEQKDAYVWKKVYGSYVDPGDSIKAAATDSLKKCCSVIGFFSDIYSPEEFVEVNQPKPAKGPDTKTVDNVIRIVGKMGVKELEEFAEELKKSPEYTAVQKKTLIAIADKRMQELPNGHPLI